jgi:hypothetical protein
MNKEFIYATGCSDTEIFYFNMVYSNQSRVVRVTKITGSSSDD